MNIYKYIHVYIVFFCTVLSHAGVGQSAVINFLAVLNIPNITPRNLKKREREAGKVVEGVARESCKEMLQKETSLTEG